MAFIVFIILIFGVIKSADWYAAVVFHRYLNFKRELLTRVVVMEGSNALKKIQELQRGYCTVLVKEVAFFLLKELYKL